MVNFNKILDESIDSIWSPRQYQAGSMAPRKDQGPLFNQRDGKNFPYQHNAPPVFPPTTPQPENTPSYAWPLQNITDDFSDAFVYMLVAAKKISQCAKENPSLPQDKKDDLLKGFKMCMKVLKAIKILGVKIPEIANMADALPPQSPNSPLQAPFIPPQTPLATSQTPTLQSQKL
jgi:hypothetical protein